MRLIINREDDALYFRLIDIVSVPNWLIPKIVWSGVSDSEASKEHYRT